MWIDECPQEYHCDLALQPHQQYPVIPLEDTGYKQAE